MNKTIVVEFGSRFLRAGFASETNPSFIAESSGILEITDTHSLKIKLIELFQIIFIEKLVVKPKEYNILIVEKLSSSRIFRNHLLTILFTEFQVMFIWIFWYFIKLAYAKHLSWSQVASVSMQPDLFMGVLSSGCSSGVIIDIGHDSTQIICFDQGRPLLHTYKCKKNTHFIYSFLASTLLIVVPLNLWP